MPSTNCVLVDTPGFERLDKTQDGLKQARITALVEAYVAVGALVVLLSHDSLA